MDRPGTSVNSAGCNYFVERHPHQNRGDRESEKVFCQLAIDEMRSGSDLPAAICGSSVTLLCATDTFHAKLFGERFGIEACVQVISFFFLSFLVSLNKISVSAVF